MLFTLPSGQDISSHCKKRNPLGITGSVQLAHLYEIYNANDDFKDLCLVCCSSVLHKFKSYCPSSIQ